jgi:hypothetical protein
MKVSTLSLKELGLPLEKRVDILIGSREELSSLWFRPPKDGVDYHDFSDYGHQFSHDGVDIIVVKEGTSWGKVPSDIFSSPEETHEIGAKMIFTNPHASEFVLQPSRSLPSVTEESLTPEEIGAVRRNIVVYCGTNSIDDLQNYVHLDEQILGEECHEVAKFAVQIFYNQAKDVRAYTHKGQWIYLCPHHFELYEKTGYGNAPHTVRHVFEKGEIAITDVDVGTNVNVLVRPTRLHAVESLKLWTPKVELRRGITFNIFDQRRLHMPSRYFHDVSGCVTQFIFDAPKEYTNGGRMVRNTVPSDFVPPLFAERPINTEVGRQRRLTG